MAKIPFDIKFRPQIESGEYKVETKNSNPVEIICWDRRDDTTKRTLVGIIRTGSVEEVAAWTKGGKLCDAVFPQNPAYDLFLTTPEPEFTEFEQQIENLLNLALPEGHAGTTIENTKRVSAELLDLARKELSRQGNIVLSIEDFEKRHIEAQEVGRKEALKDLPRWEKANYLGTGQTTLVIGYVGEDDKLFRKGRVVLLNDLEKLPGFKEE